jgi:NADH dehydrogenase FAD-containing subunit
MRIVILGGGYAGVLAALRLANRGLGGDVTLVNASAEFVERVRNHELGAATPPPPRTLAGLLEGSGVKLVVARATAIDPVRQIVALSDGSDLAFDRLIYALGSIADFAVPGAREHALSISGDAGARKLRAAIDAGASRVLVVGGGLTGVEIASELAEAHPSLRVTLVAAGGVAPGFSPAARAHMRRVLEGLGVRVLDAAVREVRAGEVVLDDHSGNPERVPGPSRDDHRRALPVSDHAGLSLACEACVWATGFRAPPLARAAGLAVNERDQVLVDGRLRSLSHASVYAVGDAAFLTESAGAPIQTGCKYAMPMAVHAADNLARATRGRNERSFRFGDTGFCVSLGRRDGVVQLSRRDGTLAGVITGRWAAFIKERIVRYTIWSLRLERHFAFYRWLSPPRGALPAGDEPRRLAA